MTPGRILDALRERGTVQVLDGDLKVHVAEPLPEDLIEEARLYKPWIIRLLQIEPRLERGLDVFLRPMEASGQMGTQKYERLLAGWLAGLEEYQEVYDGMRMGAIA